LLNHKANSWLSKLWPNKQHSCDPAFSIQILFCKTSNSWQTRQRQWTQQKIQILFH